MEKELFETGPIRPPSEAGSYLVRLTRGCPWNRCGFCVTYRKHKFEIRDVETVLEEIDAMALIRDELTAGGGMLKRRPADRYEWVVANALTSGGRTVFLQDADSLAMKPENVRRVLARIRDRFPEVTRVTTYARSRTLASRSLDDLKSFRELGLTRIHVGMETAHDPLLELIHKGVTWEVHVKGGKNAVAAGMEVSEYVMPGLGGREMSEGHARDTASALSEIDPHFIRLRTLCLHPKMELSRHFGPSGLTRMTDFEIVEEIGRFISALNVTRATLTSDHILNLLGELNGSLSTGKEALLAVIERFFSLPLEEKLLFQAGRRAGRLEAIDDLKDPTLRAQAVAILEEIGAENLEESVRSATARFI